MEIELKAKRNDLEVRYRWVADIEGFDMPVQFGKKGSYVRAFPTEKWQKMELKNMSPDEFEFPIDLFLVSLEMND